MAATGHLLSLKVMRVSRPSTTSAWEPFYSSSPSFSAHSTGSIVSLQGKTALPGHPKTLRDLSHVTEVLMLPSSFGAIQLGETFTSCISVNNEANMDVESVVLTVEMQTATTKAVLAQFGGPEQRLALGESLERIVSHEIKELVSYRLPPGDHATIPPVTDPNDPGLHVFRKFYKFAVTNPLSVKTKVHVPRAPSALLSRPEREKVFLEIHIQNLTEDAMWLERMHLECADSWKVHDVNLADDGSEMEKEGIFSGSMALMQPQDMRQYVYVLSPVILTAFPVAHAPGSIVPLGRLDISWRSSFGEPGRLLTSMLSRRIPLIQAPQTPNQPLALPAKQHASAIPLHLQRTASLTSGPPSRPRSPQLTQRPMSPPAAAAGATPFRPGSPFRSRTTTQGLQSPIPVPTSPNPAMIRKEDVEVDLVVRTIPRDALHVEQPFTVAFTLNVSAPVPLARLSESRAVRLLSLVVQHLRPPRPVQAEGAAAAPAPSKEDPYSPRLPASGLSSPSPYGTPQRADFQDFLARRLLVTSPRRMAIDDDAQTDGGATPAPFGTRFGAEVVSLPPPFVQAGSGAGGKLAECKDVVSLGGSAVFLPQLRLAPPSGPGETTGRTPAHERNVSTDTTDSEADSESGEAGGSLAVKVVALQDFELSYLPLKRGFVTFGGLRVVLIEDVTVNEGQEESAQSRHHAEDVRVLKEWDVVGEIWVES
ncbi:predicted protein [Postia placenta Mad-698-R]|nr:predicted protein [Postia placenta Mad-698-R]